MSAVPKLLHTPIKSLTEVQSERDNAPECQRCLESLDEDDWKIGRCKDCQSEDRKAYEREYGSVSESDYVGGRGMPRG